MKAAGTSEDPIIIKKYANRRLYNTDSSSYVTLDFLSQMVKDEREFKVVDAKSGNDLTRTVLTQIIVEEESKGETLLPLSFLRQLIAFYGGGMDTVVPKYLEHSMAAFAEHQDKWRQMMTGGGAIPTLEDVTRNNLAMFEQATKMWTGGGISGQTPPPPPAAGGSDDLAQMRAQMAAMQSQLNKMADK